MCIVKFPMPDVEHIECHSIDTFQLTHKWDSDTTVVTTWAFQKMIIVHSVELYDMNLAKTGQCIHWPLIARLCQFRTEIPTPPRHLINLCQFHWMTRIIVVVCKGLAFVYDEILSWSPGRVIGKIELSVYLAILGARSMSTLPSWTINDWVHVCVRLNSSTMAFWVVSSKLGTAITF